MLFFSPPMQFNLNAAGGGPLIPEYWYIGMYDDEGNGHSPSPATSDADGNVYLIGSLESGHSQSYGQEDGTMTKFDKSGNLIWQIHYGNIYDETVRAVAVDSQGNIYGLTRSDYNGSTQLRVSNLFKLNSDGVLQWQRMLKHNSYDVVAYDLVIDSNDNLYTCGQYYTSVSLERYCYIAKYNNSGTLQWKKDLDGAGRPTLLGGMAVTSDDTIIAVGSSKFGLPSASSDYGFAMSIDTDGNSNWIRKYGDGASDTTTTSEFYRVTIDNDGLSFYASATFRLDGVGVLKASIADGSKTWARNIVHTSGNPIMTRLPRPQVASNGDVYVFFQDRHEKASGASLSDTGLAIWNSSGTNLEILTYGGNYDPGASGHNGSDSPVGFERHADGSVMFSIQSRNVTGDADGSINGYLVKLPLDYTQWPASFDNLTKYTGGSFTEGAANTTGEASISPTWATDTYMTEAAGVLSGPQSLTTGNFTTGSVGL